MENFAKFVFRTVQVIPNLGWIFLIYIAFGPNRLEDHVITILNISLTWEGILILTGVAALALEVMKSTAFDKWAMFELILSVGGLITGIFFVLQYSYFQTETFLIIVTFQVVDVVVGMWVMVSVARRDIGIAPTLGGGGSS